MSKKKTTQGEPTRPVARDAEGFALDEFGLPLAGPRRLAALSKAGKRDPREFPEDWAAPPASKE